MLPASCAWYENIVSKQILTVKNLVRHFFAATTAKQEDVCVSREMVHSSEGLGHSRAFYPWGGSGRQSARKRHPGMTRREAGHRSGASAERGIGVIQVIIQGTSHPPWVPRIHAQTAGLGGSGSIRGRVAPPCVRPSPCSQGKRGHPGVILGDRARQSTGKTKAQRYHAALLAETLDVSRPAELSSQRNRVENCDRQTAEMSDVERKQLGDAVALHGGHEANVVRSKTRYAVGLDQRLPKATQLLAVVQQHETPFEETEPVCGLGRGHSQSVAPGGRRARPTGRHRPKLVQVLRDHDQPLSPSHERLNRPTCGAGLRVMRPRHPRKQVRVEEDHSPSIRV